MKGGKFHFFYLARVCFNPTRSILSIQKLSFSILLLLILAQFSLPVKSFAQEADSLRLKKYYKLIYADSSAVVKSDTVIPADTNILKVKKRWHVRFYYKYMYVGEEEGNRYVFRKGQSHFEGKTVGSIRLMRLEPFGTNIDDTVKILKDGLINTGNAIHAITNKRVILNNLLFDEGDVLGALTLAESERLLRSLEYIQDVRIYGETRENSDTVDILVITKDVFSIDLGLNPTDYNEIEVMVRDANMFGLGHEFRNNFIISTERRPGYEGRYSVQSIFGTYMRADIQYANTPDSVLAGGGFNRDFVSTEIHDAGGVSYFYRILSPYQKDDDDRETRLEYGGHLLDGWYGHSFPLKTKSVEFANHTTFVIAGRSILSKFTERPENIEDSSRLFQDNILSLVGLTYSRSSFHKEILLFRFGITEDIPVGRSFTVTGGYQAGEAVSRYYTGVGISIGRHFRKAGYFFNNLQLGSFIHQKTLEDGAAQFTCSYYSRLIAPQRDFKERLFFTLRYVHGINRTYLNDRLDFYDYNILPGIESFDVSGNNVLGAGAGISIYSPWNLFGFRIGFQSFADISYVSEADNWQIHSRPYWGMGAGLRLNNESFLFGTISSSVTFYPSPPPDVSAVGILLSVNPSRKLPDFNPSKPQTAEYSRRDKVYYYF